MRIFLVAVIGSVFAVASCDKASETPQAPPPPNQTAEPAQPELTPGQKMQKRREDLAAAQIQAQLDAQMNAAPAKKSE